MRVVKLLPVPPETVIAASALGETGTPSLSIGDRTERIGADVPGPDVPAGTTLRRGTHSMLRILFRPALVRVFQFLTGLPDDRAVDATRIRVGWK